MEINTMRTQSITSLVNKTGLICILNHCESALRIYLFIYFFKPLNCVSSGRHRWVIYTTEMNGKKTLWEVDGSMVPAEWYSLLHSRGYDLNYHVGFWTLCILAPQAPLAALHDGWSPYHTPTGAQEVPGRDPPDQRECHTAAVRALLHHAQEDPRVGSAQSRGSVSSPCLFVNYGLLLPVNKISIQTLMAEVFSFGIQFLWIHPLFSFLIGTFTLMSICASWIMVTRNKNRETVEIQ